MNNEQSLNRHLSTHKPHIDLMHDLWAHHLRPGDTVIDATCGNGHDSLLLAKLTLRPEAGELHCVDIQKDAIASTKARLEAALTPQIANRIVYHCASHTSLPPCTPNLIVYNLGYLPGSDKQVKTSDSTTLASIEIATEIIADEGVIAITCYPGHLEGGDEERALLNHLENLDRSFTVRYARWINRKLAPSCIVIQKSKTV